VHKNFCCASFGVNPEKINPENFPENFVACISPFRGVVFLSPNWLSRPKDFRSLPESKCLESSFCSRPTNRVSFLE